MGCCKRCTESRYGSLVKFKETMAEQRHGHLQIWRKIESYERCRRENYSQSWTTSSSRLYCSKARHWTSWTSNKIVRACPSACQGFCVGCNEFAGKWQANYTSRSWSLRERRAFTGSVTIEGKKRHKRNFGTPLAWRRILARNCMKWWKYSHTTTKI